MSTEKSGGAKVFLMLYPLITATLTLMPWAVLLLPMLYAFILVKVGDRSIRNLVALASYMLSWLFLSVSFRLNFIATYLDSFIISGVVATSFFIMAHAYAAAARKRKGFWFNVGCSAGALLGCGLAATAVLHFGFGGNAARSMVSIFTNKFHKEIVVMVAQYSAVISDYTGITSPADIQGFVTEILETEPQVLISTFAKTAGEFVSVYMGGILVCASVAFGLCLSWSTALLAKIKKFNFMEGTYVKWDSAGLNFTPPYALFYPRRVISSLVVALLAMWILKFMDVPNSQAGINIVSVVLTFLWSLSGIFFIDFLFKRWRMGKGPRMVLILLVAIPFMSGILPILGIVDSLFGFRRRAFMRPKR